MIPILYDSITEGSVPSHNGLGALSDCISCQVKEERNGSYELVLEYATSGIHAEDIAPNRFIKAKPNFTDSPQIFRIYKVGKTLAGRFTVYAQHISYDLSGKLINWSTANSATAACYVLGLQAGNFTISTDISASGYFDIYAPSSVRSWFGGKSGSLIDVYGGEWHYDNYTCALKASRGANRGVVIEYGKNLTELSQELNIENLATGVLPYYIDQDGNITISTKVSTGLVSDVDRDIAVDFSQDVDPESATSITDQLDSLAARYVANHNLTNVVDSITLDFVQLSSLQDRVDLCDTVTINFTALGISGTTKCVATTWDVLLDRYTTVTFGQVQSTISDTIVETQRTVEQSASRSYLADAVTHATDLISGNLGGYVVLHDSDSDGEPDEILIMNTADITTATKVWRWNKNGLGYSSNGYAGPYGLAMTSDGEIVADYITTGTLTADLIKAGVISDVVGNSTIDMTNGAAVLDQLKAKTSFRLIDSSTPPVTRASMAYSVNDGTLVRVFDAQGNALATMDANPLGFGVVAVGNSNGGQTGTLAATADGGVLQLRNKPGRVGSEFQIANSDQSARFVQIYSQLDGGTVMINDKNGNTAGYMTAEASGASFYFKDSGGPSTIYGVGASGSLVCVSLTQTSSRKVKKNIKPIKDAKKILDLEAVSFDYKNKAQGENRRGFIAEDVAEVLPNLVTPETEQAPASLDYIQMIPYLQTIIKDQEARITALENKIKTLEG